MEKNIDTKKIIETNPKVDRKLLQEARRTIKELRRLGIKPSGYNLAPPFARQVVGEVKNEESR